MIYSSGEKTPGDKKMPWYKMEINFQLTDYMSNERKAQDIESECYEIVKKAVGDYKKITMDLVFEIPENEKDI